MALLRKLFACKAMDGLSRVSERVFVFNSCLSIDDGDGGDACRDYLASSVIQLKCFHPHGSLMVINFADDADGTTGGSAAVDSLLRHGVTAVARYPSQYAGCPSLPLSEIRAFLGSCVEWLVSDRQRNVLLMHCEGGVAWPTLAFAMASLLAYVEETAPEHATLDAVYAKAPMELLAAGSALDPRPSHLRYLQYVTTLREAPLKGMRQDTTFFLDCLILRAVPDFDGEGGCTPVVRVHGRQPQTEAPPEVLFSTSRIKQHFKQYKQTESAVIKANIECQIQGDVVMECVHHVGGEDREEIMFRVMFSTCFLQSNMIVFALGDLDLPWNCGREKFQEDFKIEVFFSELEASDTNDSRDESVPSSIGNADEFYDFHEILDDSDFNPTDQKWRGETSRQDLDPEQRINTEEGEIGTFDTGSSSSSEEKGSISNSSSDDEAEFSHGAHVTRETKYPTSEEASCLVVGSSSAMQLQPVEDLNIEMPTIGQENGGVAEEVTHQGAETSMQKESQGVTSSIPEVNHTKAGYGALNPQLMRKTKQKHAPIIPPVPIIRKKVKKPDNGSDDKKPTIGKMLLKAPSQKGPPDASSSSKNCASEAMTTPSPQRQHQIANRLKKGAAQAIRSNLSKEHLRDGATATSAATEVKQATFTLLTPPSSPQSPLGQELNQQDSRNPFETTKKSSTQSLVKPRARTAPKQEATTASNISAPRRTPLLKKSLSSPAISQTPTMASSPKSSGMTSLPGVKTTHPRPVLPTAASTTSPRARKQSTPLPPSPRRPPLVGSKTVVEAVLAAQPDVHQGMSASVRLPRRASFSELSHSLASTSANNARSLSPRTSRTTQPNHQAGMKGNSSRSSSPLSPRLSRAHTSPKRATTVSVSDSENSSRSGAALARLTRLSS